MPIEHASELEGLRRTGALVASVLSTMCDSRMCDSATAGSTSRDPDATVLADGDLVNIDLSTELDGCFADTRARFVVGPASPAQQHPLDAAREAREPAIARWRAGGRLNGIGRTIGPVAWGAASGCCATWAATA